MGKKQDKLKSQVGTPGSVAGKIKQRNKKTSDALAEAGNIGTPKKPKKKGQF